MIVRDLHTFLPAVPVGHVMGLPQIARHMLFSGFPGKAILLTTPERLPLYSRTHLGVQVGVNPGLEQWPDLSDKVVLDIREAIDLFPKRPQDACMVLDLGQSYGRPFLRERLESLGYTETDGSGGPNEFHFQGDTLWVSLPGSTVRAEFFGDVLDALRQEGTDLSRKIDRAVIVPAEGYLAAEPWNSTRLEQLSGRVFLDVPELYSDTLGAATELLWAHLRDREVTAFGRTPLGLGDQTVAIQPLPFYRARLSAFAKDVCDWTEQGKHILFLVRHAKTGQYLEDYFKSLGGAPNIRWVNQALVASHQLGFLLGWGEGGFEVPETKLIVLTEDLLYGFQGGSALRSKRLMGRPVTDALGLQVGDFLIHPEYGIGQFLGVETLEVLGVFRDYLSLQYKGDAKIRLPIELLPTLRRHSGTTDNPPALSGLGKQEWIRAKEKAQLSAEWLAQKLLVQYAARKITPGYSFSQRSDWDALIEKHFPHNLTRDQVSALAEVQKDLEADCPMDRLIAGDVGFGKTEVAVRAAHRVVGHGKQVAVLVPTTLLAEQHASTFMSRFKDLPVRIESLSRFTPSSQEPKILKGLQDGTIDIVIGTHRLLSKDIRFKDLGLIVVDEEHRFGVIQKERLKVLKGFGDLDVPTPEETDPQDTVVARKRTSQKSKPPEMVKLKDQLEAMQKQAVDVLSLSATPIPRTLYMSMVGLRDMSQIQTPPRGRKPIQTVLSPFDPSTVRNAIVSELERGGKVFYIHDRIASIGSRSIYLRSLVPEARVGVVHGQMGEEEIEEIMLGFEGGAFDVLLSTTIVETGLDIPEANTILIERADRLGLAQLYQLRGRVGRRDAEAYAYLFYPSRLTANAARRLWAIADLQDLGSGHRLAEKDMEIRGVGNLLGNEQHGQIQAVSVEIYTELLAEAVMKLKGETPTRPILVSIDLPVSARLSTDYFGDESERIAAYGALSEVVSLSALSRFERDMRKRYGTPPTEVQNFIDLAKLRIVAASKRVVSIKDGLTEIEVAFAYTALDYDAATLKQFPHKVTLQQFPPSFRLSKKGLQPEAYPQVLMDVLRAFG